MIIKQLSVFLENKKGRLAAVMSELAGHNIDVSALSLADTTDFGVLRLIVNRPEEAKRVLTDSGVTVRITDMVATVMADRPGGAAMKDVILNDVGALLDKYPHIERIFLNGGEACRLFSKMNIERAGLSIERLPSTSPAYTLPFEEKLEAWRRAFAGRTERMI